MTAREILRSARDADRQIEEAEERAERMRARLEAAGVLLVVSAGIVALRLGARGQWRRFFLALAAAVAGLVMLLMGTNAPRVKEIKACASGPVSLEQIAAVYDIREVDGALIVLWER